MVCDCVQLTTANVSTQCTRSDFVIYRQSTSSNHIISMINIYVIGIQSNGTQRNQTNPIRTETSRAEWWAWSAHICQHVCMIHTSFLIERWKAKHHFSSLRCGCVNGINHTKRSHAWIFEMCFIFAFNFPSTDNCWKPVQMSNRFFFFRDIFIFASQFLWSKVMNAEIMCEVCLSRRLVKNPFSEHATFLIDQL